MSIPVRHSGRIAFASLIVIALMAALVGLRLFASAGSETDPPDWQSAPADQPSVSTTLQIGPIAGLTTDWHSAPATTSISLGTIAWFFEPAPPDSTVIWTGADEVARDDWGSTAVCWLLRLGAHVVHVEVIPPAGEARSNQSLFNVVDVPIEQITVSPIDVWVDPVKIDEDLTEDEINEQTMGYYFGQSIAALRDLGYGQYRTSVNRVLHMSVEVDPPGFAPLMEWRVRGQWTKLGGSVTHAIDDVGLHDITVGPLLNPEQIEIETYSVTITSHTSGEDIIPEGEPVVFIAETDPPGYENDITWLSSTKYGTAEPILGEGPIFIAKFNDTWGYDLVIGTWQWLGVKADNVVFNQDQAEVIGIGIAWDEDDEVGPVTVVYVYDTTNEGIIEEDDVILSYRGHQVDTGADLFQLVLMLPDVEVGDSISLEILKAGKGQPVEVFAQTFLVALGEFPTTFQHFKCVMTTVDGKDICKCSEPDQGNSCVRTIIKKQDDFFKGKFVEISADCLDGMDECTGSQFKGK